MWRPKVKVKDLNKLRQQTPVLREKAQFFGVFIYSFIFFYFYLRKQQSDVNFLPSLKFCLLDEKPIRPWTNSWWDRKDSIIQHPLFPLMYTTLSIDPCSSVVSPFSPTWWISSLWNNFTKHKSMATGRSRIIYKHECTHVSQNEANRQNNAQNGGRLPHKSTLMCVSIPGKICPKAQLSLIDKLVAWAPRASTIATGWSAPYDKLACVCKHTEKCWSAETLVTETELHSNYSIQQRADGLYFSFLIPADS